MAFNWQDPFGLGGNSPYGSPFPGVGGNPYNPAAAFQYDPATIRRAAISNALLSAGAAMLGQGPSRTPINFGTSLGQGVAAGLQGADTGAQQAMQRQQFAQGTVLGGQQYKAGQQALVGGAINNQFALMKVNGIRQYYKLPPVTMEDLTANPDLVDNPTKGGSTPGSVAPSLGGVNPMAAPPASDPTAPGAAMDQGSSAPAPNDIYAPQQGVIDTQMSFGNYDEALKEQFALEQQKNAPTQAARVAAATDAANAGGTGAFVKNASDLASTFTSAPTVQQYNQALVNYGPMLQSVAALKAGNAGASEYDVLNSALKIFNPEANMIRPGQTASLEDMKGIPSDIQKLFQAGFGGGAMTDKELTALVTAAQNHFYSISKAYGATVNSIDKQSNSLPVPVPQDIWRRDLPPKGTTPPIGYYKAGFVFQGGDPAQPASWYKLP